MCALISTDHRRVGMTEHAVVIAGGGPTGMMLAAELTLAGVDVAIVERCLTQEVESARAGGLYARTIEVLDQRGIADHSTHRDRRCNSRTPFAGRRVAVGSMLGTRHSAEQALLLCLELVLGQRTAIAQLSQGLQLIHRRGISGGGLRRIGFRNPGQVGFQSVHEHLDFGPFVTLYGLVRAVAGRL